MLTLYIDVVAEKLVMGPNSTSSLSSLLVKQGEIKPVAVVFLQPTGNAQAPYDVTSIPAGFTQIIIAAAAQALLSTLLFDATGFEAQGEGDSLQYVATMNVNTDPVSAAMAGSISSLPIYVDVTLMDDAGDMVDDVVKNQVGAILTRIWSGDPAAISGNPYPPPASLLTILTGVNFDSAITGLVGGGAANLDGIATVLLTVGYLQDVVIANVRSSYQLQAGAAGAEDTAPADYNAGTNNKKWVKVS